MDQLTRNRIREIFLSSRRSFALFPAAQLLGISFREIQREIETGAIVAVSTPLAQRVAREELIAAAMRMWEQAAIEEALGEDAAAVLPEALRLVELRAWVPLYQREVVRQLAQRRGTSFDTALSGLLEDASCAYAEELATVMPDLDAALLWPERAGDARR
jgi:hypothetical protein